MKTKLLGIAAWILAFILTMVFLFALAPQINATVISTSIFVLVAYVGGLILLLCFYGNTATADERFLRTPGAIVTTRYMLIQIPVSLIFGLGADAISYKISIIVNAIILVIAWIKIIGSVAGQEHIQKVNLRQKDHHTVL